MLRTAMAAVLVMTAVAAGTPAHAAGGRTTIVVEDGATQPVFDYDAAIVEDVWVEAPLDTDRDGVRDRVHLNITRPGETETAGLRVASLIMPTPYGGVAPEVPYPSVDVDRLPQEGIHARSASAAAANRALTSLNTSPEAAVSTWEYYTTRGYAMIAMDSLGTATSTGCPDAGGPDEIVSTRAVVDWLDGRGRAFDADGNVVSARWSARSVGMYGVSYNGTLPIMAAITGRSALKTIIPMSAVTSWYDYYRANGLVVAPGGWQGEDLDIMAKYVLSRANPEACAPNMAHLEAVQDRVTGDYSPVWAARDYTAQAHRIRASVFVVQGLQDWNVKPKQGTQLWSALSGVDRKLWLYDRGHGSSCAPEFAPAMHRWVDHYLYRVDSGIEDEAPVTLEDDGCTVTGTAAAWPVPGTRDVTFPLATGRPRTDTFTDDGRTRTAEQLIAAGANRLSYELPALTRDTRLSGTPWITADVSIDRTAANLTALLVDHAPDGTATILTRGWTDPQNRRSVSRSEPVEPGKTYRLRWDLQPLDRTVPAGHRLGVVVISTDYDYTLRPLPGTRISVRPVSSSIRLPMS